MDYNKKNIDEFIDKNIDLIFDTNSYIYSRSFYSRGFLSINNRRIKLFDHKLDHALLKKNIGNIC